MIAIRNLYRRDDVLVALLEDGTEKAVAPALRSFYVKTSKRITGADTEPARGGYQKVRGRWKSGELGELVSKWRKLGLEPLEADVRPEDRFLADRLDVEISKQIRWLIIDLECNDDPKTADIRKPETMQILSFAYVGCDGKRGFYRTKALTNDAERDTLRELRKVATGYDILVAWNGGREYAEDGFDFPVIRAREKVLGIRGFDWYTLMCLDQMLLFRANFLQTSDGGQRSSFALGAVGRSYCGIDKVPIRKRMIELGHDVSGGVIRTAWEKEPALLEEYNLGDVDLCAEVERRSGFLDMHLAFCRLAGCLPRSDSLFNTRKMDAIMLRLGTATGYHWPTKIKGVNVNYKGGDAVGGAAVMPVKPGLHHGVSVLDVSALYPSIIRALNLSPESKVEDGAISPIMTDPTGAPIVGENKVIARFAGHDRPGQLAAGVARMQEKRVEYEQRIKQVEVGSPEFEDLKRLSNAAKVAVNAFYGIILQRGSRYYDQQVGEAVTSTGRLLINSVVRHIEAGGHKVIMQDTDSAAFCCDPEQAEPLIEQINQVVFPAVLGALGVPLEVTRRILKIKYEERYRSFLLVRTKGYAGIFDLYRGNPVPADQERWDVKGLECVKGSTCKAARSLQREVVERILRGDPTAEIRRVAGEAKKALLDGPLEFEDVAIREFVRRDLDAYVSVGAHVRMARRATELGLELEGGKVAYWHAVGAQEELEDAFDEARVDRRGYWDDRVWKACERVVRAAFPHEDWGMSTRGNQTSLFAQPPPAEAPARKTRRAVVEEDSVAVTVRLELGASADDGPRDCLRINRMVDLCKSNPGPCRLVVEIHLDGSKILRTIESKYAIAAEITGALKRFAVLPGARAETMQLF